ncbi:hypothetical protein NKI94_13890 [Mesorhizobium australicum]|uniref:hypothetical protein n=1 Tax=Mesorhizobium australicum TaxID=536018 RepID=UPI003338C355
MSEHLKRVVELTTDWYNQLLELQDDMKLPDADTERLGVNYAQNRYILPKLMLHRNYLSRRNVASDIVDEVDRFLKAVTIEDPLAKSSTCIEALTRNSTVFLGDRPLRTVLQGLDGHVQTIARKAAELLAANRA